MSEPITAIKGFADMFAPASRVFTYMENTARQIFTRYGYGELRTPIVERTDLFFRGIGTETDVVQKEMYTFLDRKGRSLTLRPEATAGVIRAYLEHKLPTEINKFFTFGPMFRYERPQKGRLRQFHQINCECLGAAEPLVDAELICMILEFLHSLGLNELSLQLNSLGCAECRPQYKAALSAWLAKIDSSTLCEDCQRRLTTNPLRVLDCKVRTCQAQTKAAPQILDYNCPDCTDHFTKLREILDAQAINYVLNPRLVRGLDYYTRTTFEIVSDKIGSQGTVAGGGRYDGLVAELGGPAVPGIGFACGVERLALLMPPLDSPRPDFYMVVLDQDGLKAGFQLTQSLRQAGLNGEMTFTPKSMKSSMRQAGKSQCRYTLILGGNELASQTVMLKNMDTQDQQACPWAEVVAAVSIKA